MPSARISRPRAYPIGAELCGAAASFRVWAPARRSVSVVFEGGAAEGVPLTPEADGYFSGVAEGRAAGELYLLALDKETLAPDPASRFQPRGPHGPSELVDPSAFRWTDAGWPGLRLRGQVFYELHVGTFTPEGTWRSAAARVKELAHLGVSAIEIMPVAEVPGRFNWGYDGVSLFAPTRNYGRPDDFRFFVDRCHALGVGVVLDVVYNHLGPDGNYLKLFSPAYFSRTHTTDWGEAVNYDSPQAGPVRDFMTANAAYWIAEYHLDGLRLDATQNIYDDSPRPIFVDLARSARRAAGPRSILLIAENETQQARFVAPVEQGGYGFDALWNDDFHHSLRVALTGRREAYYLDYAGTPQELISSIRRGYLYQGQWYSWQKKRRGTASAGVPSEAFISYLENHDQVANATPQGRRLVVECSNARLRATTAALLLGPGTPLLFQGQERGARAPFMFFAEHKPGLRELVFKGRKEFMSQFPSMATPEAQDAIADPAEEATYSACRLSWQDSAESAVWTALHRDLLELRREDPVIAAQRGDRIEGAVLSSHAFCLRFLGPEGDDRLLLVNLGPDLPLRSAAEPLLAPPPGARWDSLWSSEDPRYGGDGTPALDERAWFLGAESARLLRPIGEDSDAAA